MDVLPVELMRQGESGLQIRWSDGSASQYTAALLRAACPCASCREKHSTPASEASAEAKSRSVGRSLPVLSLSEARPLNITGMRPVGNYAYNIAFSDGHDSGIYTFEYLVEIAR
jgi:DUF971 family protein